MMREEAIAAGVEVYETQHSMKRRTPWHDYSRKGTYMLTLVVKERMALLGTLKGCLEGEVAPYVEYSALGSAIIQEEQKKINRHYPQVEVWKLCIMPDHLHMIVRVNEDMGEGVCQKLTHPHCFEVSKERFELSRNILTAVVKCYLMTFFPLVMTTPL